MGQTVERSGGPTRRAAGQAAAGGLVARHGELGRRVLGEWGSRRGSAQMSWRGSAIGKLVTRGAAQRRKLPRCPLCGVRGRLARGDGERRMLIPLPLSDAETLCEIALRDLLH